MSHIKQFFDELVRCWSRLCFIDVSPPNNVNKLEWQYLNISCHYHSRYPDVCFEWNINNHVLRKNYQKLQLTCLNPSPKCQGSLIIIKVYLQSSVEKFTISHEVFLRHRIRLRSTHSHILGRWVTYWIIDRDIIKTFIGIESLRCQNNNKPWKVQICCLSRASSL